MIRAYLLHPSITRKQQSAMTSSLRSNHPPVYPQDGVIPLSAFPKGTVSKLENVLVVRN